MRKLTAREKSLKTLAAEAGSKILSQSLMEKWLSFKQGYYVGDGNVANVSEHSFDLANIGII